jgi:cytochrome c556
MTKFVRGVIGIAAGCSAAMLATLAMSQDQKTLEKAVAARQGLMKLIVWEAGPLFAMAKGDIPYDAAVAEANAKDLNALTQYGADGLFLAGTSNAEMAGKTAALPAIWENREKFVHNFDALRQQTANVAAEAGKGQAELTAAVAELGKACGNCHENFRQKQQ